MTVAPPNLDLGFVDDWVGSERPGVLSETDRLDLLRRLDRLETPCGSLTLRRAWPRDDGSLHLDYAAPGGGRVAAQWLPDHGARTEALRRTGAAAVLHPATGVLLQAGGADARLRSLAALMRQEGSRLVVHRPERRAVVRLADGDHVKVVRRGRSADLVTAADRAAAAGGTTFSVPAAIAHDSRRGTVRWQGIAAPTLADLWHRDTERTEDTEGTEDVEQAWRRTGLAVRALQSADPSGLPLHSAAQEVSTAERAVTAAVRWGLLPAGDRRDVHRDLLAGPAAPTGVLHRDLHDKQVLVDPERLWLLDTDTLAVGERALDVANVLAHLELRVAQAVASPAAAETARAALLDGLAADPLTLDRVGAHLRVARLRLAGVYAFRPGWRRLARRWYDAALAGAAPDLAGGAADVTGAAPDLPARGTVA